MPEFARQIYTVLKIKGAGRFGSASYACWVTWYSLKPIPTRPLCEVMTSRARRLPQE